MDSIYIAWWSNKPEKPDRSAEPHLSSHHHSIASASRERTDACKAPLLAANEHGRFTHPTGSNRCDTDETDHAVCSTVPAALGRRQCRLRHKDGYPKRSHRARGNHTIGENCILNCYFSFDRPEAQITIGRGSYIGNSHLVAAEHIIIGNDVVISWDTTIVDHNSHSLDWRQRANDVAEWHQGKKNWSGVGILPVTIEDNVWIGFGVTILKGVTIGKGAVVGAASVVTKDVAPFTVVAGVPAKKIRDLSETE